MDTDVVDDDSIDTEALQAQIDLSMSFAQSLVSSWMEPHKLPTSSRNRDLEKELSEYMKRPPRLGVGASIPEGHHNISRDAARLKGNLTKRPREGEYGASAPARPNSDDEDEDESRAAAIKKKQKLDPFDIPHGKKKKKHHAKNDAQDDDRKLIQSPSRNEGLSLSSNLTKNELSPESRSAVTSPSRQLSEPDKTNAHIRNPTHAELLKRPLLNLTGPPTNSDDDESDGAEAGATTLTSPKKKRKRRKKKKHPLPLPTVLRDPQT